MDTKTPRKSRDFIKKDILIAIPVLIILPLLFGFNGAEKLNALGGLLSIAALIIVWLDRWDYSKNLRSFLSFSRWLSMYSIVVVITNLIPTLIATTSGVITPVSVIMTLFGLIISVLYYRMMLEWSNTLETESRLNGRKYRRNIVFLILLPFLGYPLAAIIQTIDPSSLEKIEQFNKTAPLEWLWSQLSK